MPVGQGDADVAHLQLLAGQMVANEGAVWAGGAPALAEDEERVLQVGFHRDLESERNNQCES